MGGKGGKWGVIAVLRLKEWVNRDDKDSRQRERERMGEIIYIYTYIYTHTHTHIYIYIYEKNKMGDIRFVKINDRYIPPKIIVS